MMNIYLDIDGVLVGTASPMSDIVDLLEYILERFPHSTYWLTTHCRWGSNQCAQWLEQNGLPKPLVDRLHRTVRPTHWHTLKTEAIDFSIPFVWLDDALLYSERAVLHQHHAKDGVFLMDSRDDQMALKALAYLKSIGD